MPARDDGQHEVWDEQAAFPGVEHDEDDAPDDALAVNLDEYRIFSVEDESDDDLDRETAEALPPPPDVADVLEALERGERHFSQVRAFSDLSTDDLRIVAERWPLIAPALRATVIREAIDLIQLTFEASLSRFLRFATTDDEPEVRQLATAAIGHEADRLSLETVLDLAVTDTSEDVRAEAANSLGPYATYAAYGELPAELASRLERVLFDLAEDEDESWHIRRRAAESAAIFGPSARVERLAERMYDEDELGLRAAALYVAGRGSLEGWITTIIDDMQSDDAEIRFEAVRAAGALGKVEALPELSEIASGEHDVDVRHAAITAIAEIGGPAASRILTRLVDVGLEVDQEVIAEALADLETTSDPGSMI
jgi:HEAT repeat protein